MYHIFFIHSSVDGHLGCFHVLAIVNSAAVNTEVHVFFRLWFSPGITEDEMVGWPHRLNGHGFGWTPEVGDEQGGLVCCGSWGHNGSDITE